MLKTSTNKSVNGNSAFRNGIRLQLSALFLYLTLLAANIFAQPVQFSNEIKYSNFPGQLNKQFSLIAIYDSVYSWEWDTFNNGWKYVEKSINIIYDVKNNLTSYSNQLYDSSNTWINSFQYIFNFDVNNNRLHQLTQRWNSILWENYWFYTSTYDANNNLTSELSQEWIGGVWENSSLAIYTYDGNNNQISSLYKNWDSSMWVNSSLYTYTYDSNNNRTSSLGQNWNGSTWDDRFRATSSYDANNNPIIHLSQFWNGVTWENSYKSTYTYDVNNNQTSTLSQNWNLNIWENSSQFILTYDSNNNMTDILFQIWNNNAWETNSTYTYTYDSNNFPLSEVRITSGTADSTYLYFHVITGVDELFTENEEITAYPNPFDNELLIKNTGNKNEEVILVDMLGNEILRSKIFIGETKISTEKLLSGFYLLKFTDGNKKSNIKLIKY